MSRPNPIKPAVLYGLVIAFALGLIVIPTCFEDSMDLPETITFFGPLFIGAVWKMVSMTKGGWRGSLAKEENKDADKLVNENVFAPLVLVVLIAVAQMIFGENVLDSLVQKANGALVGLLVVYPWLGLIRAVFATHWSKD